MCAHWSHEVDMVFCLHSDEVIDVVGHACDHCVVTELVELLVADGVLYESEVVFGVEGDDL